MMDRKRWLAVGLLILGSAPLAAQLPPTSDEVFRQAMSKMQEGELAQALALLEKLRAELDQPPAQLDALIGALYVEQGRSGEGLAILTPLAEAEDADPAVLYNAGRAALSTGRWELAAGYLERSVRLERDSPAARELGILRAQLGAYREAYLLLRHWAQDQPEDTEARILAALCALQLKRPNEAEELLSDLPQDDPRVRLLWGKLLLEKADPFGALATLKPLAESPSPEMEMDIRRTLADAYAAIGQSSKAVETLRGHLGGNPSVALQLAQAQYQSGDLDGALDTLEPFAQGMLRELPAQGPAPGLGLPLRLLTEYGRLLATSGRHADAIPYLEPVTRLDPAMKESWHQLGQALAATGRVEEAKAALQRFQEIVQGEVPASVRDVQLEKDLEDPTGRELRDAMRLFSDGEVEEALLKVRREKELAQTDPRPWLLESRILLMSGRAQEALAAAQRAIEMAPDSPDSYYAVGTVLMSLERPEEAEAHLRQALAMAPDHTAALNDLAMLLIDRGQTDEARQLLERALAARPDDAVAAENLERLQQP